MDALSLRWKLSIALVVALATISISACSTSGNVRVGGAGQYLYIEWGQEEDDEEGENDQTSLARISEFVYARIPALATLIGSSGSLTASDLSQMYVEFQNLSNTSLTGSSGSVTVTVYSNGTAIAANSFGFYRSGSRLYLSDPYSVANWLQNYESVATSVDASIDGSTVFSSGASGTVSSYTAAAYDQNNSLKGATTNSWTNDGSGDPGENEMY